MRFWDSSAIVPLALAEARSRDARRWLHEDSTVVVWTLTRVELLSAWPGVGGLSPQPEGVSWKLGASCWRPGSGGRR